MKKQPLDQPADAFGWGVKKGQKVNVKGQKGTVHEFGPEGTVLVRIGNSVRGFFGGNVEPEEKS